MNENNVMNYDIKESAIAKNLINQIDDAANAEAITDIIAHADNKSFDDVEWGSILMYAAKHANITVDELLSDVESTLGYEHFLDTEAEEQYWAMMNAENPIYGCDPYSEY